MDTIITTVRNADLITLSNMLQQQNARKADYVVPSSKLLAQDGMLHVVEDEPMIFEDGVSDPETRPYLPTLIGDEGIAEKLGIPLAYMRRLRNEHTMLWDHNVNGWLAREVVLNAERNYMVRTFRPMEEGEPGIMRAFLSDRFGITDNFDALMAVLDGVRATGLPVDVVSTDLTERRMVVRLKCEAVSALAPVLLRGYRSPYTGNIADENPIVFSGLELANSETGNGAWTITPRMIIEACGNGLKVTKDAMRSVHLGGRLEAGAIKWSDETQQQAVNLLRSKTADAVKTFLDVDYMTKVIEEAEEKSDTRVRGEKQVKALTKAAKFTDAQADEILSYFIEGGQPTVGGVFNAATYYAQQVEDPDVAFDIEAKAASLVLS